MCLHCLFEGVELILLHPTEEVELNSNGRVGTEQQLILFLDCVTSC